jgi:hypothetical protein
MRDTAPTTEAILARLIPRMTGNLDSGQFWPAIESNVRMADHAGSDLREATMCVERVR